MLQNRSRRKIRGAGVNGCQRRLATSAEVKKRHALFRRKLRLIVDASARRDAVRRGAADDEVRGREVARRRSLLPSGHRLTSLLTHADPQGVPTRLACRSAAGQPLGASDSADWALVPVIWTDEPGVALYAGR